MSKTIKTDSVYKLDQFFTKEDVAQQCVKELKSLYNFNDYAARLELELEQHDDDRDKLDVADWLERYEKTIDYNCSACGRDYILPTHIDHFNCVCGQRCRLRHVGGVNPDQAVIDAAIKYFGTERMAQLAYIAEIVGGKYCEHYTADDIRKMIRQEMDRWVLEDDGWRKK
jgi:hypothetical protein